MAWSFALWTEQLTLVLCAPLAWRISALVSSHLFDATSAAFTPAIPPAHPINTDAPVVQLIKKLKENEWLKQRMEGSRWMKLLPILVIIFCAFLPQMVGSLVGMVIGMMVAKSKTLDVNTPEGLINWEARRERVIWLLHFGKGVLAIPIGYALGHTTSVLVGWVGLTGCKQYSGLPMVQGYPLYLNLVTFTKSLDTALPLIGTLVSALALFHPSFCISPFVISFAIIMTYSLAFGGAGSTVRGEVKFCRRLGAYALFQLVSVVVVLLVAGFIALLIWWIPHTPTPPPEFPDKSFNLDDSLWMGLLFVAPAIAAGTIGSMVPVLYRFDVSLQREKANPLYEPRKVLEIPEDIIRLSSPKAPEAGTYVAIPPVPELLTSKEMLHSWFRLYSTLATAVITIALLLAPQLFKSAIYNLVPEAGDRPADSYLIIFGQVLACLMSPGLVVCAVGVAAWIKGDLKDMLMYEEVWGEVMVQV